MLSTEPQGRLRALSWCSERDVSVPLGCVMETGFLEGPVGRRRELAQRAIDAGIRHTFTADHVSFHTGMGMDGLLRAALVSTLHDELAVHIGVYLLALRHPLPVARQVCELASSAPGRIVLGVGVGGEDPHEFEVCGVDPKTRGRRTDESLAILRPLLGGETVSFSGRFFDVQEAKVRPIPRPGVPIVVGGRAPAALARAARFGDGWLGIWSDAARYAKTLAEFDVIAASLGRADNDWQHGLQLWVAVDDDRAKARARLAARMEAMYRVPYERFARYAPAGSASEVADFLRPIIAAGCRYVNILAVADSTEQMIDDLAAVKARLAQ